MNNNIPKILKKLNIKIPQDYIKFLQNEKINLLRNKLYYIPPNLQHKTPFNLIKINAFINYNNPKTLTNKTQMWIKKGFLPIAYDKFFNIILINLNSFQIYIWDKNENKFYLIAQNFDSFYSKLY